MSKAFDVHQMMRDGGARAVHAAHAHGLSVVIAASGAKWQWKMPRSHRLDNRHPWSGIRAAPGWMLASGIVDLFLAVVILAGLPGTIAWALGLVVGINMVFGGTSMIGMALAAHAEMP
jgi:hypothetical protein